MQFFVCGIFCMRCPNLFCRRSQSEAECAAERGNVRPEAPACIHSAPAKTGAAQTEKIPAAGVWCARVRSEGFKESPSYGAEGFLQVIRYKGRYPGSLRRDLLHGATHSLTHEL